MKSDHHVLILAYVWPEPQSSAAGLRTLNLIETFVESGWQVTVASPSKQNVFSDQLRTKGIPIASIHSNSGDFDSWIKEIQPDTVVFDRFVMEEQFGWRVRECLPSALRILDTQDLHFLRRARERAVQKFQGQDCLGAESSELFDALDFFNSEDAMRETASILRSHGTWVLSDFERSLLIESFQVPADRLFLSRFHYQEPPPSPSFEEREGFSWIGNFRHPPNLDGLRWFFRVIWPRIREQLPAAKLSVYGAYPPKEIMNLSNKKLGIEIVGSVKDAFEVLSKHRVNLAPLRFGAGIKGKITDGWWSGTPVVTTPIGAEGMSEDLPWGGEIASDPVDFSEKAVHLHGSTEAWEEAQMRGYELIRAFYSKSRNSAQLMTDILSLKNRAPQSESFNQKLLNFHSFKGSKYFSKWIEEKNRLI